MVVLKTDPFNPQAHEVGWTILALFVMCAFCYVAQISLIMPLVLLLLGIYLFHFRKASIRLFLNLGLLLTLILFAAHYLVTYTSVPAYYIPVSTVAMLTILLFNDLQLAFVMSLLSSVTVAYVAGGNLNFMLTFFIGSISAAFVVNDARTRGQLLTAGLLCGAMQVLAIILFHPDLHAVVTKNFAVHYINPLALNGLISALIVSATLKVFESLFGVLTNYSLLELSDFNHPLLRRMVMEAPGTYHHSLVVSNLAESAADAIGANALLTRVGAYYHDIGKLGKPEYFTENQMTSDNKHDKLEPTISRLVILNHVKDGIELAKKHKLNPLIIDFIPQHHGTSLIHYFYHRALEETNQDISEENFRYPGPKPQMRETAIVLLADSVEGATRALDEHTPGKIEDVVRKVINNKFIDGQLDECTLTLKDIEKISDVFTRVLTAMYHSRIKYPEKKNGSPHSYRKSTESTPDSTRQNPSDPQNDLAA